MRKTLDTNADGTIEESLMFVHDNGQIVLDFEKTGTAAAGNSDLAHRYLWGNSVDQLLADETFDDGSDDDTAWALTDHLGSVRDLVEHDTGTVSVVKHLTYDAFGNVTSDSATAVKSLFLYTARPFDADTDLQNNLNRWYDLSTGRWMSVDPIGFEAGDVNLYRYVGNTSPVATDPSGLWFITESFTFDPLQPPGKGTGRHTGKVMAECNDDWETLAYLVTRHESDSAAGRPTGPPVLGVPYSVRKLLQLNEDRMRINTVAAARKFRARFIAASMKLPFNAAQIESYFGSSPSQLVDCYAAVRLVHGKAVVDTLLRGEFDQLYKLSTLPIKRSKSRPTDIGDRGYIENNRNYISKHTRKGPAPGENVILVGRPAAYWGFIDFHGTIETEEGWKKTLLAAYNRGGPPKSNKIQGMWVAKWFPHVGKISEAAFNLRLGKLQGKC